MDFTEENIRRLFGHEAAEDDDEENLYGFYIKGSSYTQLKSSLPLYVLVGHKGTGKSALLKILEREERLDGNLPITIRPDDIFEQTETDLNRMVTLWQEGLSKIIFNKLIENILAVNNTTNSHSFKVWLSNFSKLTLSVLGHKFADIKKYGCDIKYKDFLSLFKNVIFTEKKVTVFIDDLDRGWKNADHDIKNISALLNALRNITRAVPNVKFRIALRSSVYYSVRTSDESTDKIENSIVWLKWTNHEILSMLVKRILLYKTGCSIEERKLLEQDQYELSENFEGIFEKSFKGRGHWENAPIHRVLLSLIRQRPRDLVKLCTLAAKEAQSHDHTRILTQDLENVFKSYSQERLTDTVNEYNSELTCLQRVLLEMKPETKNADSPFVYTPQNLYVKMGKVLEHVGNIRFTNSVIVTKQNLAGFLYKINFFTARKDSEKQIIRYYYDENKYIHNEDIDFGFNYEVHPAYRWALQPKNLFDYMNIELLEL